MANPIKAELKTTKLKLQYFKARNQSQPNPVDAKWIEIFTARIDELERKLVRANAQRAANGSP